MRRWRPNVFVLTCKGCNSTVHRLRPDPASLVIYYLTCVGCPCLGFCTSTRYSLDLHPCSRSYIWFAFLDMQGTPCITLREAFNKSNYYFLNDNFLLLWKLLHAKLFIKANTFSFDLFLTVVITVTEIISPWGLAVFVNKAGRSIGGKYNNFQQEMMYIVKQSTSLQFCLKKMKQLSY